MADVKELNINNTTYDIKAKSVVDTNSGKVKFWTGTQAEFDAITTKDADTLYNVTDTDPSYSVNTQYKNIGAIVQSMVPLTDAGLHLLDGSLIQMGVYSEFVEYMADLYGDGTNIPSYFCTETEWQTAVTTYGVCGKFVYDSVNNTVRLPKITGIIEGTTDVNALGDLVVAGLPNITGTTRIVHDQGISDAAYAQGVFYQGNSIGAGIPTRYEGATGYELGFNASRSSSIYGNSSTVQPQTVKVLYYIVVATSTKTDIQVDIDDIATDLNGKADVDLTNVNNVGYIKMAGAGMPSDKYIDLTLGASGSTYTAPADGYISLRYDTTSTFCFCHLYVSDLGFGTSNFYNQSGLRGMLQKLEVRKGSTYRIDYSGLSFTLFRFIYAVGSESEAN